MDVQEATAWLRRLANLDLQVFEDIRTNPDATVPSVLIAALSMFLAGIGGWLWWVLSDFPGRDDILVHSAIIGSLLATVLWGFVWLLLVYVMLTQVFREQAYVDQLLRVMGLAASPMALMVFMFIPGLSLAIGVTVLGLTFMLTNVAVRSVTTADNAQVLASTFMGFFVWCCALTLLASSAVEPNAPGVFLFNAVERITSTLLEFNAR